MNNVKLFITGNYLNIGELARLSIELMNLSDNDIEYSLDTQIKLVPNSKDYSIQFELLNEALS